MSSPTVEDQTSKQCDPISNSEEKVSRDSTGSNQSGGSISNSGESSTKATIATAPGEPSNHTASSSKHLDPSPALPLANPRKQKSTGILNLRRSPSGTRQRSGSFSGNIPKPDSIPPLPLRKELGQPPKSILTPSSSSSSLSHSTSLSSALSRSPSIQFAPLPQLAPRKRKSSVPLGIAARSAMMQRRRQVMYGTSAAATFENPQDAADSKPAVEGGGMWTPSEAEAHLARQMRAKEKERERLLKKQDKEMAKEAAKLALKDRHGHDDEVENDDPLVAFGRLVKDAWRKVGKKDSKNRGNKKADLQTRTQSDSEVNSTVTTKNPQEPPPPADPIELSDHLEVNKVDLENNGGLVEYDSDTPTEEDDHNNDDDVDDFDANIDPNEVDVSMIVPLRTGSPPPLHVPSTSHSHSETSSIAESDDSAGSDSTMTSPPATSPPSPNTLIANTHTRTSSDPSTLERAPSKNSEDSVATSTVKRSERSAHRLPSLELTPLSPFLVT
ncbi:hypothetical protein C8J55DRAFT_510564 [Lentinula edodes]|uniref:Uncharacterized protein n=1 Tax=Lentinula lateritia TaxID=40482 RepID=A0A9W9DS07_9AGAR|nr:hypothetical protein C8J55DRAFT_510564 [Lentinula edodes]